MKLPAFFRRRINVATTSLWWVDSLMIVIAGIAYIIIASLFTGQESSYFDEGYTSYLARLHPLDIAHYTAFDVHPPLYYVVLHYWQQLVGIDVFWLRFLSVIWGVIAIIFAFLLARKLFGQRAGWSVLVFVVLSPLFIRYSEAMRMYTMAIALVTAGTYVLALLTTSTVRRPWILWCAYAGLVAAGMWTNYFTAFIWLSHLIWLLYERRSTLHKAPDQILRSWLIAVAAAIVLYLPWLPALIERFSSVQATGFWIKPISVDTLVSTITTATVYLPSQQTVNWLAPAICVYSAVVGVVAWRVYHQMSKQHQYAFRLLLACSAIPIIGLILLSLPPLRSSYVYRYVLNGVFMTTILVGVSVAMIRFKSQPSGAKIALYAMAVIILGIGVVNAKIAGNRSLDTGVKNMVAQAIDQIHAKASPGEPIVSRSPYTYFTAALYETADHPTYYIHSENLSKVGSTRALYDYPQQRGIKNLPEFAARHKKLWILAEDKGSAATPPAPGWTRHQSFTLYDPVTRIPTAYGAEYVKP